ncbi:YdiU family protein [Paenibacillus sp. GCM10027627]|uniref:protein adenylyltransferase SelO n=1 Tax=unclassified Paenibacillus TaxID=185978 RepID=UPI0036251292
MTSQSGFKEPGWHFDNNYARLPESFFSAVSPAVVSAPELILFNSPLAEFLGLHGEALNTREGADVFAGNRIPEGAAPLAQAYAGHQFGHFTMLGDGRALLLGEQITPQGERYDIALKGSGATPYSRRGDGRAALGPMLREYIISEAMHGLGIATTRSLAVAATGEPVYRETVLPGAVLTRVASSHLRVGTFQYAASKGFVPDLQALVQYALQRHYPEKAGGEHEALTLLQEVIKRQAALIAKWQLVGFVHGVMNTDNMAISGETIDYGPCAFMDVYDPATVFSSIDSTGRYAYGRQPYIAAWNLARLAESLLPLLHEEDEEAVKLAEDELAKFPAYFHEHWVDGMRAKLGLFHDEGEDEDEQLIEDLLRIMKESGADYTNTFKGLTVQEAEASLRNSEEYAAWHRRWQERIGRQRYSSEEVLDLMRSSNPAVIPRNHRVEEALEAASNRGDYLPLQRLLAVLSQPFAYSPEQEEYAAPSAEQDAPYRTFCGT